MELSSPPGGGEGGGQHSFSQYAKDSSFMVRGDKQYGDELA